MDVFNELAQESHDACTVDGAFSPREVAEDFVSRVSALEGSGRQEPVSFLRRLTVQGAAKWLADFRRKTLIPAKTKSGAVVDIPAYAGIRVEGAHKQMAFFSMPLDVLRTHRKKLAKGRDTVSREIAVLDALIKAMSENPDLATAGDAFRKLGLAA